ncbi:MAG TPA: trypsin-like peptidase domain-containing protein, partial [Ktedonobacterales bacterium]|nr:trypsin-like peptidase domain-containing protein [Ktedonobacterales bacterium]
MRFKLVIIFSVIALLLAACSAIVSQTGNNNNNTAKTNHISNVTTSGAPPGSSSATLEQQVVSAINKVEPAVVEITVTVSGGQALASGSIISSDGYVLTNDHVVQGGTNFVVQTTGATFDARVAGEDPADDLAVLKVNASRALPAITFADSVKAQVGEFVVAVGNPLGVGQSASFGIISALNRTVSEAPDGPANNIPNAIQTSAPINHGNSGGALIDLSGNLVGIPTLGAIDPESGGTAPGIGFAIPANHAKQIAQQIIASGKVTNTGRAYLGVDIADVTPDIAANFNLPLNHGCYIQQITNGGPAASAGLKQGDIIYQLDSALINNGQDLS